MDLKLKGMTILVWITSKIQEIVYWLFKEQVYLLICHLTFDKHPAKPGESLYLTVEMTPKESGMFDETIIVKCNTEQPIQLKIRGQTL